MLEQDLNWLAGLLEGEAWFGWKGTPIIAVQMSDLDVIKRVAQLFDRQWYPIRKDSRNKNGRPMYQVGISSQPAIELMQDLYLLMGERRKKQIRDVIVAYNKQLKVIPRLKVNKIRKIKQLYRTGNYTYKKLANMYSVCEGTIGRIIRGERYSNVI
jgi:hypothetical protein